jgi:collagen type VI alpha
VFQTVFTFDQYTTKVSVQNAIKAAVYRPGQTDTDQALGYAASTLFTPTSGARVASAKVAVVITDGGATHSADAIARATELKNKGVSVFVIGTS